MCIYKQILVIGVEKYQLHIIHSLEMWFCDQINNVHHAVPFYSLHSVSAKRESKTATYISFVPSVAENIGNTQTYE